MQGTPRGPRDKFGQVRQGISSYPRGGEAATNRKSMDLFPENNNFEALRAFSSFFKTNFWIALAFFGGHEVLFF